ncbi:MAG: hypothetical protein EA390_07585 [Balneolaceae bacterium]|nr:MAG: hypothetical protein EA390_07585 [Balneolaceae bacterium]
MAKFIIVLILFFFESINLNESKTQTNIECDNAVEISEGCKEDNVVTYTEVTFLWLGVIPTKMILPSCADGGEFRCPKDACETELEEETES